MRPLNSLALKPFSAPQRLGFFTLCVVGAVSAPQPHGEVSSVVRVLALAGIAIAVWHGAFDGVLARPILRPRFKNNWMPVFVATYLLLMGIVAALWWCAPILALPLFLFYSAWHFGTEGEDWQPTLLSSTGAFCRGFLPIAASCYWHPAEVSQIFALMLRGSSHSAGMLAHIAGQMLVPVCVVAAGTKFVQRQNRSLIVLLTALEVLLFWRAEPLIAFAIFFCCWHTPEHLAASCTSPSGRLSLRRMGLQLRSGLLPWLVSLAGLALLLSMGASRIMAAASSVFLLLSALTVPHMLLNELRRTMAKRPIAPGSGVAHAG